MECGHYKSPQWRSSRSQKLVPPKRMMLVQDSIDVIGKIGSDQNGHARQDHNNSQPNCQYTQHRSQSTPPALSFVKSVQASGGNLNQALAQACAFYSPFCESMRVIDSMTMSAPRSE